MAEDLLSVAQAAALLGVEPRIVWQRIEEGSVRYSTLLTAKGIVYLIDRQSLFPPEPAPLIEPKMEIMSGSGNMSFGNGQDADTVQAFVQRLLDPLASRLETVSIELGRERRRREIAEHDAHDLDQQLQDTRDRLRLLEATLDGESAGSELRERARQAELRIAELERQLAMHSAGLAAAESAKQEVERLQTYIETLERNRAIQADAIDRLTARAQDAEQRLGAAAARLEQTESEAKRAENWRELLATLLLDRALTEERVDQMQEEGERARRRIDDLERELALRESASQAYEATVRELERARELAKLLETERDNQYNALVAARDRAAQVETRLGDYEAQVMEQAQRLTQLEASQQELESLRGRVKTLSEEKTQESSRRQLAQDRAERADSRIQDLERQMARLETGQTGYDSALKELAKLQEFVAMLERDRENQAQAVTELRARVQQAGQRAEELATELDTGRALIADYETRLHAAASEIERLKQYVDLLEHDRKISAQEAEQRKTSKWFWRRGS